MGEQLVSGEVKKYTFIDCLLSYMIVADCGTPKQLQ